MVSLAPHERKCNNRTLNMYINRQIYLDKIFIKIIIQIYRKETRIDRHNNNVNFVFEYMLSNAKLSNMFVVLHNKQTGEKKIEEIQLFK